MFFIKLPTPFQVNKCETDTLKGSVVCHLSGKIQEHREYWTISVGKFPQNSKQCALYIIWSIDVHIYIYIYMYILIHTYEKIGTSLLGQDGMNAWCFFSQFTKCVWKIFPGNDSCYQTCCTVIYAANHLSIMDTLGWPFAESITLLGKPSWKTSFVLPYQAFWRHGTSTASWLCTIYMTWSQFPLVIAVLPRKLT